MGKGWERGPKRRGFDDDDDGGPPSSNGPQPPFRSAPRATIPPSGPPIDGVVKWYNADKGFGFVELVDGSGDVFLHAVVLEAAGHDTLEPGTKLSLQIGFGQRGRQIAAILSVDANEASGRVPARRGRPDPSTATEAEGTVKWYHAVKGYGFVLADDGEKDVFIHAKTVERAGLRGLDEGQRLAMKVIKTPKGREAISITLLD
jgi:CspA family cold shock protein